METNAKKLEIMKLNQIIDGCNTLLGTLKIRVEDIDESGEIIKTVRLNLTRCSAFIQADLVNAFEEATPVEEVREEVCDNEEEVTEDVGDKSEPEPTANEPIA